MDSTHPIDLALTPAALPPAGILPNFVNPPSQQNTIIAVSTVMIILTVSVVATRLYSNFRIIKSAGIEDYMCIVATVFSMAYIGFVLDLSYVARHMWDVPLSWFTESYWKVRFAQNTIQAFAFLTSRIPILLLYLRLFGSTKPFRIAVYFAMVAAFCVYMAEIPLISYFCTPPRGGSWGALSVFSKCQRLIWYAVVQGSCNIFLDLFIFILPLRTIFGLHLQKKRKYGIFAIFGFGFLAVIASAVSFYYRYQLSFTADVNWNEGIYIATATVEINIAIICSSIPACASLFTYANNGGKLFSGLRSIFSRSPLHSTESSGMGGPKASYGSSYLSNRDNSIPRATWPDDSSKDDGYIELRNARSYAQVEKTDNQTSHGPGGITRTVEVDIV